MLTGSALGAAIKEAMDKANMSQAEIARKFNVKPPSVSGWIKTGRISKGNFEKLRVMFADVVSEHHWGFHSGFARRNSARQPEAVYHIAPAELDADERVLIDAFRKSGKHARTAFLELAKAIQSARGTPLKKRASHF